MVTKRLHCLSPEDTIFCVRRVTSFEISCIYILKLRISCHKKGGSKALVILSWFISLIKHKGSSHEKAKFCIKNYIVGLHLTWISNKHDRKFIVKTKARELITRSMTSHWPSAKPHVVWKFCSWSRTKQIIPWTEQEVQRVMGIHSSYCAF